MVIDPSAPGACCRKLLSEGLDLCVRARQLDAQDRRQANLDAAGDGAANWESSGRFDNYVARHNVRYPDTPISTRSGTVALWVAEHYQADLADWENRVRKHLLQGCGGKVVVIGGENEGG